jgi:hypothetical protein
LSTHYRISPFNKIKVKNFNQIIIITDSIPLQSKRKLIEKSIKQSLANFAQNENARYDIFHHSSKSHFGLQIADYCNWAIFRKYEKEDCIFYENIKKWIKLEEVLWK